MLKIIILIISIFLIYLIIKAAMFKPYENPEKLQGEVQVDKDKIVKNMCDMIKCKTISYNDENLIDYGEFEKFKDLLKERYPKVHEMGMLKHIGKTGLLYCIKGKVSSEPSVYMAHYDVVPVQEELWEKPPFDAVIEDGCIWGRGTLDTKGTLLGVMEAAEYLLENGFKPEHDMYISFSGQEEINGDTCRDIVKYLEENGVHPGFVLDEGGAVVENVFPGVNKECALIGIGEKLSVNIQLDIESNGGHASMPPVHTIAGELSQAVVNIEKHPSKGQFVKPVKEMFDTLGRHASFGYKIVFANMNIFLPILKILTKKIGGELNAMMRSTCAVTKMSGSKAFNVLPSSASVGMNIRLMGEDTVESFVSYLNGVINNPRIKVNVMDSMEVSGYSDTDCVQWNKLQQAVHTTWPDAIVSPYLMMACSDSRNYTKITDKVYKFSAMKLSKEERGMIHGNNERVPIETLIKTVEFYIRMMKLL